MCSVFFVLGFSVVFSIVGVALQSILVSVSSQVQTWLSRIGGIIIVLFGLYLLGIFKPEFLERDYKINVTQKFTSAYVASFIFGAAFAVGWTPCVGAILGAILTLAISNPSSAFLLMLSYSLGLGIPFLVMALFLNEFRALIPKTGKFIHYFNLFFGVVLIGLGILVFFNQLSRIANFPLASQLLLGLNFGISTFDSLNLGIAFIAGILSFFSPCVLPILPGFISYLAAIGGQKNEL